jgi:hypothetical protein
MLIGTLCVMGTFNTISVMNISLVLNYKRHSIIFLLECPLSEVVIVEVGCASLE